MSIHGLDSIQSKSNEDHPYISAWCPSISKHNKTKMWTQKKTQQHLPCIKTLFCHIVIQEVPRQHLLSIIQNVNPGCTVPVCGKPQLQTSQMNMKTKTVCVLFCNTLEKITDFMLAPLPHSPSTQDRAPLSI